MACIKMDAASASEGIVMRGMTAMKASLQRARWGGTFAVITLAAIAMSASPVMADDGGMRFEVGPQIGVAGFSLTSGLGDSHYRYDVPAPAFGIGLRASVRINSLFAVDLFGRYSSGSFRNPDEFEEPRKEQEISGYKEGGTASVLGVRVLARYNFKGNDIVTPFATFGGGVDNLSTDKGYVKANETDTALQIGGGALVKLTGSAHLRIDASYFVGDGAVARTNAVSGEVYQEATSASHNYEILAGVVWEIGGPAGDSDGDGLTDDKDKCPDKAEDKDGFQDTDGCPDPDNDGDGVQDVDDKCPNAAEDKDNFQDYDGCPEPDNDGDGIKDAKDRCPNKAEDRDGYYDKDGCPDLDNDKDKIPDTEDKCPNKAEDFDHFQDTDGCPELDNDNDGVPDAQDKCPSKPETKNGMKDDDGCPDSFPEEVKQFTSGPVAGITFDRRNRFSDKKSRGAIQRVLKILNAYPKMRFELHCHADIKPPKAAKKKRRKRRRRGKKAKKAPLSPMELSLDRCESVHEGLVKAGVKADRIVIKARGNSQQLVPTAGLKRKAMRKALKQNNRYEFKLMP
jgi:outer membrane protein OmpA-like peptidoglycan-associated protein